MVMGSPPPLPLKAQILIEKSFSSPQTRWKRIKRGSVLLDASTLVYNEKWIWSVIRLGEEGEININGASFARLLRSKLSSLGLAPS